MDKEPKENSGSELEKARQAFQRQMEPLMARRGERQWQNLQWLLERMPGYFFISMGQEQDAILDLANRLDGLTEQRRLVLDDRDDKLILARLDQPGSLYDSVKELGGRPISYAEMNQSLAPVPGGTSCVEVQKFEFGFKSPRQIAAEMGSPGPEKYLASVRACLVEKYPGYDMSELERSFALLWLNNPDYVAFSPTVRVARILWLFQMCRHRDGLFFQVEELDVDRRPREHRVLFAVGNPPTPQFMSQAMEVFNRLNLGVRRFYALTITSTVHPFFLGTFYVMPRDGQLLQPGCELFDNLRAELYNTQILASQSLVYNSFVAPRVMAGQEAALIEALINFCHTALASAQPDRYDLEEVRQAFLNSPGMALELSELFHMRFAPGAPSRQEEFEAAWAKASHSVDQYNTGHQRLDEVRRVIFRSCLAFIRHCLKTNFFVAEKHALAFRLDPAYLQELTPAGNPVPKPFRVTFFHGRHGMGYHIGFADIARGGWRTVICPQKDDYVTAAAGVFQETLVLAQTQHLKNKDIYEGGSKLVLVLDALGLEGEDEITQRLYKLQYGVLNAFLDIFVTQGGRAKNPRVVDYYQDDEPIELGPDENMHDAMVELIARQAVRRGYILGTGIISSKKAGINHKHYGVTSHGVIRAAEIALSQVDLDPLRDPVTVRLTGGPFGDVAGNCMRLILKRWPLARILSITDGSGAMFDPQGIDREELGRLLLERDLEEFEPSRLSPGGFMVFRHKRRQQGQRQLHRKLARTRDGLEETWITVDEYQACLENLLFSVPCDLFLPCGGRPETVNQTGCARFFPQDQPATVRVVVEGANSFITPAAREIMQRQGVVLLRDATANKCGVISSSYEILANLLMNEEEFMAHKEPYVADVLRILEKRAADEARLIFARFKDGRGQRLYTEISEEISREVNRLQEEIFALFQQRPELAREPLYQDLLAQHFPEFIRSHPEYRRRLAGLPAKVKHAILASEAASFIVYQGGWDNDLEGRLGSYLNRQRQRGKFGGETLVN